MRATAARLFHGFDLMPAAGPGSLARAFLHHLLPNVDRRVLIASFHPGLVILLERMEHARRCVVLDTDMLLLNDIGIVWSRFAHFGPTTMIATSIVVDHTPTSIMAIKLADLKRAGVGLSLQVSLTSQHMRPRGGHHPMRDRISTPPAPDRISVILAPLARCGSTWHACAMRGGGTCSCTRDGARRRG